MRRSKTSAALRGELGWRHDGGSASLEFITAGLILLVPLVYLVVAVAALQAGSLAVEGAARQAARVFVQAASEGQADSVAERAVRFALADHGFTPEQSSVEVRCERPDACLTRGARVTVTVTVRLSVPLPLVPKALDLATAASVPVQAQATQTVSRFWGAT
jgi:Flp pilus assembly protein TadG